MVNNDSAFYSIILTLSLSLLLGLSSPVNPHGGQLNKDVEEDDVFMPLELPLVLDSGSGSVSCGSSPSSPPPPVPHRTDVSSSDIYPPYDTHQRIHFPKGLNRSRTITGAPSRIPRQNRPVGLPPGDPGPLGDNIHQWLEKIPARTKTSDEDLENCDNSDIKLEKDFFSRTYNIKDLSRYEELPGEDPLLGSDLYGDLRFEPQYHYPNLETAIKG